MEREHLHRMRGRTCAPELSASTTALSSSGDTSPIVTRQSSSTSGRASTRHEPCRVIRQINPTDLRVSCYSDAMRGYGDCGSASGCTLRMSAVSS